MYSGYHNLADSSAIDSTQSASSNTSESSPPMFRRSSPLQGSFFPGLANVTSFVKANTRKASRKVVSVRHLNLTTESIVTCWRKRKISEFRVQSAQISFCGQCVKKITESFDKTKQGKRRRDCNIKLTFTSGMVVDMHMSWNGSASQNFTLVVNDRMLVSQRHSTENGKEHHRYKSPVTINITSMKRLETYFQFVLNFTWFSLTGFTSPTEGYVRSPGWDGIAVGQDLQCSDFTNRVDAPANHGVMISFLPFQTNNVLDYDYLSSNEGDENHSRKCYWGLLTIHPEDLDSLTVDYNEPIPKPSVFKTNVLIFCLMYAVFEFKMLFSFHHMSAIPEKTASGTWNCSVENWPHFQQHIGICDTVDECYGQEDEANCFHVYEGCGRGSFTIGGRCYFLVAKDVTITWTDAANECQRREAYLASLNTPDEWNDVTDFVRRITKSTVFFGLCGDCPDFPELYKKGFQWNDQSFAFYFKLQYTTIIISGMSSVLDQFNDFYYPSSGSVSLNMVNTETSAASTILCEKDWRIQIPNSSVVNLKQIPSHTINWLRYENHVICPRGFAVFKFLACDVKSECFASQVDFRITSCEARLVPLPPHFTCKNEIQSVPYTLVCDHCSDCVDNSDENFCVFPRCRPGTFRCNHQQFLLSHERCGGINRCVDESDEEACSSLFERLPDKSFFAPPKPPAVVNFDGNGYYYIKPVNFSEAQTKIPRNVVCPESHFLCPGKWAYCMPVFVRCNGVFDCPGREDEFGCGSYVCPGFYRCRASVICVHSSHVCDGVFHCPQRDDELLCGLTCPENCTCHGLAFFCSHPFQADDFPELRFLHGSRSGITPGDVKNNTMLVFLNISECGLESLNHVEFLNLQILDLSRNRLKSIQVSEVGIMTTLQTLSLAGNPLVWPFIATREQGLRLPFLEVLDMSEVSLVTLNTSTLSFFPNLAFLNLSGCGVKRVVGRGFHFLKHLRLLDLQQCPTETFPADIFEDVQSLTEVWAENYKLCCPAVLPVGFYLNKCHAPSDEISSCDALLRSNFYRVLLSVFSVFALLGNFCSFVYRVIVNKAVSISGFGAFVTHLCVSDFLMGVYLAVIGVADRLYLGTYLWKDTVWKRSAVCSVAGFLSLLSSEVSAFIICLITLDRFLVLRFPFSRLHFRKQSAHIACGTAWLTGVVLATIPLLPITSHWEFYSQTAICIPLPITRIHFAGYYYSFGVSIIVNFLLFLFIAMGQAFIYWSIRTNSVSAGDSTKTSNNLTIARRLITIAMSDFLCWFPIGLLGLLASKGVPIPGEVNVTVAILLLPVNSAINPFLYTLNIVLESRRQARERRILKRIMSTAEAKKVAGQTSEKLEDKCYIEV